MHYTQNLLFRQSQWRPFLALETCLSARKGQSASEAGCLPVGSHGHLIQSIFILPFSLILLIWDNSITTDIP